MLRIGYHAGNHNEERSPLGKECRARHLYAAAVLQPAGKMTTLCQMHSPEVEIGSESVAPVAQGENRSPKSRMAEETPVLNKGVRKRSYHIQWRLGDHIGGSAGDDRHLLGALTLDSL